MSESELGITKSTSNDLLTTLQDNPSTDLVQDDNSPARLNPERRKSIIPPNHLPRSNDQGTNILSHSQNDYSKIRTDEEDDSPDAFDSFILANFKPFSGAEDVIKWLSETDHKFNTHRISRSLRLAAIPLLVVEEAKRRYIKYRNHIQTFEDFYEFLLTTFERSVSFSSNITYNNNDLTKSSQVHSDQTNSMFATNKSMFNTFNNPEFSPKPPVLRSTALLDLDDTAMTDNKPSSTFSLTNNTTLSVLDHTTNDLRKAILESFVKTPKTFQGGKEDVTKWLEDLEHLFDLAQIPDPNKLALISYSLRGDALQWYKTTKTTLNTWPDFVKEIKHAFTSTYQQELAFKKLESYNQTSNQSILNYYNEMIKTCQEADPTMTESTKLKYLLGKAKPTIQFEVRRKKPTTAAEFLLYAKEIEELYQLSNLSLNQQPSLKAADPVPIVENKPNTSNSQYHPPSSAVPPPTRANLDYPYSSSHYRPYSYDNTYNHRSYVPRYTSRPRPNQQSFRPSWLLQQQSVKPSSKLVQLNTSTKYILFKQSNDAFE